ncbi:MAG: DUF456 domain-containing protein [Candidatus Moranbacteria bacterium]|nr:DUF456 domain-containing protein [Candidatus Moranbacteria bacterium]
METLIIIGLVLAILGVIGSIVPAMPGPVLSFAGVFLLFLSKNFEGLSLFVLIAFGLAMAALIVIDYLGPILGAKFAGATRRGLWGAIIGALLGIVFFPPLGIFLGALAGAFIGEYSGKQDAGKSAKAALGVILGSAVVIVLQTIYSLAALAYFAYHVF